MLLKMNMKGFKQIVEVNLYKKNEGKDSYYYNEKQTLGRSFGMYL